jgi:hypothetical protein
LSAAVDLAVAFDVDFEIKTNPKTNGSGQECPLHTSDTTIMVNGHSQLA